MSNSLLINLSFLLSKPTGISTYALNLFPHLQPLNPTLLTANNFENFTCYSIPNNLTPENGKKGHLNRLIWTQLQLPKIYNNLKSSLIFSPVPEAPIYTNCLYLPCVHDVIPLRFPNKFSPLTPYFRYYIPEVLKFAQHIICNSVATAKDITDFFGVKASKITPIYLAYDRLHFRPFNLSIEPYFIYIGRHEVHKNLHRIIQAFATLGLNSDYQLWLIGNTDKRYTPKLQQQAEELGLKNRVKFLDYLPYEQLPKVINQATALVFPSLWEGFGIPVLEAMACGTPVITSNLSSLPEVAGDAALLVNPYDTEEIAIAMKAIANESQLRSHLSREGLKQASKFTWEKTGQATLEILQRYL